MIEVDSSDADGSSGIPFDLGEREDKRASVDDFTMLKVIGKGSFGKVLLGKHKITDKIYAIKVLSKDAIVKQVCCVFVWVVVWVCMAGSRAMTLCFAGPSRYLDRGSHAAYFFSSNSNPNPPSWCA